MSLKILENRYHAFEAMTDVILPSLCVELAKSINPQGCNYLSQDPSSLLRWSRKLFGELFETTPACFCYVLLAIRSTMELKCY